MKPTINFQDVSQRNDGFGTAGRSIKASLTRLGYEFTERADINFNFAHPHQGRYSDNGYDIMYFPWESSEPRDGWKKHLSLFDEVWVPSPWLQSTVADWGFESFVYEHGVNPAFTNSVRREPSDKIIFLMQGFEAFRKGALETIRAFNIAFRGRRDVELWIKTQSKAMDNIKIFPNIKFITKDMTLSELVDLYQQAHVMVAPTYGEGFGIPSRDAMATGMPLITTAGFLPYEEYIHPDLLIPSRLIDSPWPEGHPGKMFQPDLEALIEIMRKVYIHFDSYAFDAHIYGPVVSKAYDWDTLTEKAFTSLATRI